MTYSAALRHPIAARLLAVQSVGELGDYVGQTALLLLGYESTHSAFGPGLVVGAGSLLSLIAGTYGGAALDRLPRRAALVGLSLGGAAVVLGVAAAPALWSAVVAMALLGGYRTAFQGVQAAVLAETTPPDVRRALLALGGSLNQLVQTVGIIGGAALTLALGVRVALVVDAASFVVAAGIFLTLPHVPPHPSSVSRAAPLEALRCIWRVPPLRLLTPVAWTCMLAGMLPETLAPAAVPGSWVGVAMAASPLGGVLGYALVGRTVLADSVHGTLRLQLLLGTVLVAGGAAVWLLDAPATVTLVNLLVGAAGVAMLGVRTAFITHSPPAHITQINSTMVASVWLLTGVGSLLGGSLASASNVPVPYLAAGAIILVATAFALRSPVGKAEDRQTESVPASG